MPAVVAGAGLSVEVGFRSTFFASARVVEGGTCEDEGVGSAVIAGAGAGAGAGGAAFVVVRRGL